MAIKTQGNGKQLTTSKQRLENKTAKKKVLKTDLITKPILKQKPKKPSTELSDNAPKFNFEDYTKVSYEDQTKLFNGIKSMFVALREKSEYMDEASFEQKYVDYLLELLDMAVTGNVTAMDYLCFLYKKGIDGILPMNLTLAHKWGMLAIANGSKLSVDRLRMFMLPVLDFVEDSNLDIEFMMDRYDVSDGDAAYFVCQAFAGVYNPRMGISLLSMAKEDPASTDTNFQKFMIEATKVREEVLPDILKYLK